MAPKAYSLIEVSIVIGIVGILAIIIIPQIRTGIEKARSAKCMANLRQLGMAITRYASENNGTVPPSQILDDSKVPTGKVVWYRDESMWAYQYYDKDWPGLTKIMRCPTDTTPSQLNYYHSYTWSTYTLINWTPDGKARDANVNVRKIWDETNKILLLDGICLSDNDPLYTAVNPAGVNTALSTSKAANAVSKRHNGGANCLFGDNSVRWISKDEILKTQSLWFQ